MKQIIIIDGSYYIFYRYHALCMWWSKARQEDEPLEPVNAPRFIEKFKSTFYKKLKDIEKKYHIKNPIYYVAKDCPQKDIWRMKLLPSYKQNRKKACNIKFFMKLAYNELFTSNMICDILKHPHLEADDCAAITATHIAKHNSESKCHVWIITSDHDYLQLQHPNISLLSLKGTFLTDHKNCTGNPNMDLTIKIISGDTSDNIPSIFPRCGYKTALKLASDTKLLTAKLNNNENALEYYNRNKTLIDFNEIPEIFKKEFMKTFTTIFS